MGTVIEVAARMTVPVALAVAGICLVVLALLTGPQAARLVRHGTPPPRPRRFWLTLLVAREIGTAGAAAAVAWAALASGALPAWAAPLAALYEHRFSRMPVYRSDRDNVIGTLYAKDLCGLDLAAPGFRLEPLLRPPIFVPLGMRAGDVFRELRRRKVHLALVVDEYGGIAGLVTMEDLLEELFGEIRDEYDEAEAT